MIPIYHLQELRSTLSSLLESLTLCLSITFNLNTSSNWSRYVSARSFSRFYNHPLSYLCRIISLTSKSFCRSDSSFAILTASFRFVGIMEESLFILQSSLFSSLPFSPFTHFLTQVSQADISSLQNEWN